MRTAIWRGFRTHKHLLIGVALLILGVDACVLFFRVIGLPHDLAVYAGLLTFVLVASAIARVALRPHASAGENENA